MLTTRHAPPQLPASEVLLVRVKEDPGARAATREGERAAGQVHGGRRKRAREAVLAPKQEAGAQH